MLYPVATPWFLKKLYPHCLWDIPTREKEVFLTFDDGPEPTVTPFVLNLLREAGFKATFFCIGNNVTAYPELFKRIMQEGHAVGNHTQHHLNGWKTKDDIYIKDVMDAAEMNPSRLFRPPYGRATFRQMSMLMRPPMDYRIVMWSLLSGDFDGSISSEKCWKNVSAHIKPGDIVTFHDSLKAEKKLRYVLPKTIEEMVRRGWVSKAIP